MSAQAPPTSTGSVKLDALKEQATAAAPPKLSGVALYSRFAFAGAVCCSLTHGGLTPVDVYVNAWQERVVHPLRTDNVF